MTKQLMTVILLAFLSLVTHAKQNRENHTAQSKYNNDRTHYLSGYIFDNSGTPGWLKRTNFTFQVIRSMKPEYIITTIQPVYMNKSNSTLFTQDYIAYQNEHYRYDIGGGYRYLTDNNQWLLGINSFFNHRTPEDHTRANIGIEIFHPYAMLSANYYEGLSGRKKTEQTSSATIYEKALSGYDVGFVVPVPFLPWARFSLAYFDCDTETQDNIQGYRSSLMMHPMGTVDLEAAVENHNNKNTQGILTLSLHAGQPARIQYTARQNPFSKRIFSPQSLRQDRLELVKKFKSPLTEEINQNMPNNVIEEEPFPPIEG